MLGTRVVGELSEVLGHERQPRVAPREPREVAHKHGELESVPVTRRPIPGLERWCPTFIGVSTGLKSTAPYLVSLLLDGKFISSGSFEVRTGPRLPAL